MIKVRASHITIEVPKEGAEPWISVMVQRIESNGKIVNTVDNYDRFNKRMSVVAFDIYTLPPQYAIAGDQFSLVNISAMINIVVLNWLCVRYDGTVNSNGDVIIEN